MKYPDACWYELRVPCRNRDVALYSGVVPMLEEYASKINGFFFVRYNEGGEHIRLRLRTERPSDFCEVRDWLSRRFNSVECCDYEPEVERFGFGLDMEVAHKLFEASSRSVLGMLARYGVLGSSRRLAAGVMSQLYFLYVARPERVAARGLTAAVGLLWRESMSRLHGYTINEEYPHEGSLETKMRDVWRDLEQGIEPFVELNALLAALREAKAKLPPHLSTRLCGVAEDSPIMRVTRTRMTQKSLTSYDYWWISQMHMHHNRLGLSNIHEALIAELISKALDP